MQLAFEAAKWVVIMQAAASPWQLQGEVQSLKSKQHPAGIPGHGHQSAASAACYWQLHVTRSPGLLSSPGRLSYDALSFSVHSVRRMTVMITAC